MCDPTSDKKLTPDHPDKGASKEAKARPVILLVDDDSAALTLMAASLNRLGLRIFSAANGEKALEVLQAKPSIDLVITDVVMPVMDGLELLQRIRQSEGLRDLPVILCSGNDDAATMQKASEYGCTRYLVKPIHAEFFVEEITAVLGQGRLS
jgi:CheY-like chemotaxis protein